MTVVQAEIEKTEQLCHCILISGWFQHMSGHLLSLSLSKPPGKAYSSFKKGPRLAEFHASASTDLLHTTCILVGTIAVASLGLSLSLCLSLIFPAQSPREAPGAWPAILLTPGCLSFSSLIFYCPFSPHCLSELLSPSQGFSTWHLLFSIQNILPWIFTPPPPPASSCNAFQWGHAGITC